MARSSYEDDEEEEYDDPENPDESDMDDDDEDGPSLVPCRYCGREISEDAEQCPRCGRYVSEEEDSARRKPAWIVAVAVGLLVAILLTWVAWG